MGVALRETEAAAAPAKSVFQIGGAGAVGTGSLRGMPQLARLREAGFAIWPFDAAVSALAMARHADELASLPTARSATERSEGRIWRPAGPALD